MMHPFFFMSRFALRLKFFFSAGLFVWALSSAISQDAGLDEGDNASARTSVLGEGLIPAAFGIRTDRDGNSWNVEGDGNIGRIGSTMVNSGLMLLVNEEKFVGVQPAMSTDGRELVFHSMPFQSLPGLRVQRRVILMEKTGGLCYAEIFYNGSTDAMSITVGLATNFSGNYKTFLSDRGRSEPVIPSSSESAIIVMPGTAESPKAFLFTHSNARSSVKPTISAQNRYGLTTRYQLTLDPGESEILLHHVAQVIIPQSFDRRSLLKLSNPYRLDTIVPFLPEDWAGLISNVVPLPDDSPESALALDGLESLGLSRGPRDILVIGGGTRLPGEVVESSILVSSTYGDLEIALSRVAAIAAGKGVSKTESRIFFEDGQILTATIRPPGLTFAQTNGAELAIEPGMFDQLVMSDGDAGGDWRSDSAALIETIGGDRIKVGSSGDFMVGFSTLWGDLVIGKENLIWMQSAGTAFPGYRVDLRDGTRCHGVIAGNEVSLKGTDFGEMRLPPSALKRIFTPRGMEVVSGEGAGQQVTVRIAPGDQQIVGSFAKSLIPVQTAGGLIKTASSEIRRAVRTESFGVSSVSLSGDSPIFEIERWDGGVIKGGLTLETVSVQAGGITWQIPVRDIKNFEIDSPVLPPDTGNQISALVRQLGEADWAARESATRELGALGYLARPVLQRELATSSDPEVQRRVRQILADLN